MNYLRDANGDTQFGKEQIRHSKPLLRHGEAKDRIDLRRIHSRGTSQFDEQWIVAFKARGVNPKIDGEPLRLGDCLFHCREVAELVERPDKLPGTDMQRYALSAFLFPGRDFFVGRRTIARPTITCVEET